jgi:hypothetical protein
MGYVTSQTYQTVDRILNNPPGPVAKDMEDLGSDITRSLLRFEASEANRFLTEVWGVLQLGLGAAFLISCALTAHRSKFLILASASMIVMVALQMFYVSPIMTQLSRSFDFLPVTAALKDRENFQSYRVWYVVLEFLKLLFGVGLTVRLLFDRYAWQQKFAGTPKRVSRRRRRHPSIAAEGAPVEGAVAEVTRVGATAAGGDVVIEPDVVDKTHDSHVDG